VQGAGDGARRAPKDLHRIGVLLTGLVLACGGQQEHADRRGTASRPVDDIPPLTTFAYTCDDGSSVVASHRSDDVYLFLATGTVQLRPTTSGSGAKYTDEQITWWTNDREATIEFADGGLAHCQEQRRRSVIEDAKLRGADYWAVGNEPGWTVEIAWDSIRLVTAYRTEHYRFVTPEPEVDDEAKRTVYWATASDHSLRITIIYGRCSDSMSDEEFEGTVEVLFDDTELQGCGTALH